MRSRWTTAVSIGLVVVLLAITAFLCSPWHRHNRLSGQACSFSSFEHATGLQASAYISLAPPALVLRHEACLPVARILSVSHTAHSSRAPPA